MGDFRTVAAITRAIATRVDAALAPLHGGARVKIERPGRPDPSSPPHVTLFLYHVEPSPYVRDDDLPTRENGRLVHTPTAALDLYYLLTFFGDGGPKLDGQLMLGLTVAALHAAPFVDEDDVSRALASFGEAAVAPDLAGRIALTPFPLSLEDIWRLWATFPQVPYTLSVSYKASAAFVASADVPVPALAARQSKHHVSGGRAPVLAGFEPEAGLGSAIELGSRLVISGAGLGASTVRAVVGGVPLALEVSSDERGVVTLTSDSLRAGAQALLLEDGATGLASRALPLVLRPTVTVPEPEPGDDTIAVDIVPRVAAGQRVTLLLNHEPGTGDGRSYAFPADAVDEGAGSRVEVPVGTVVPGSYLVRVEVDGAASALAWTEQGFTGPLVQVPTAESKT